MKNDEMTLKELFDIFWSRKLIIVLITCLAIILGTIYTFYFVDPIYSSSTRIILVTKKETEEKETVNNLQTELNVNTKLVSTYSELIKSKSVLRQVISNLNIKGLDENILKNKITVSSVKDTGLIEIKVRNEDAKTASEIANNIATVFSEKVQDIYKMDNVYIVDKAEPPKAPSNENHKKDIALSAMFGLAIAAGYVLLANLLDTTVKDPDEIEKIYKLPILASIPLNHNK